jgi:UDPglucose 6-dehydrogenase
MDITIGIVGLGFVGGALQKSFEIHKQNLVCYDKYKNIGNKEELFDTDIIFLCLPTPYVDGFGYDTSALHEICRFLSSREGGFNRYMGLVVIKSTVEPGVTAALSEQYHLNIAHNPEFLTARTAFEDFHNQKHIVIGRHRLLNNKGQTGITTLYHNIEILHKFYTELYPDAQISVCSSEESESMKLFCNSFYAAKVQMFNEFYLLCQRTGANFKAVKELMLRNGWINEMHTTVPGPDGSLSYGGACFPKDTSALRDFMKRAGSPHEVLEACISERNKIRKD